MPIEIVITADNALEAHQEIAALAGLLQARNVAYSAGLDTAPGAPEAPEIEAAPEPEAPAKRTKAQIDLWRVRRNLDRAVKP